MKSRQSYLSLVVLLAAVALSVTACPPPFFNGTSFHEVASNTSAPMPGGLGLMQKTVAPGFLALAGINDATGENTVTIKIYGDMGINQTSRRLSMWDNTTDQYVSIVGNETWANAEIKKQIEFRPYVNPANVNIRWDTNTIDTHQPVLLIDISDALNSIANAAGQVWQIKVNHIDVDELGENPSTRVECFKTDDFTLKTDRVYAFREGSGNTDRPTVVSFSVADEATDVLVGEQFELVVSDAEGLGELYITLLDKGDLPNDTSDDIAIPMPATMHEVDENDNHTYTFDPPTNLDYETTYYLMIGQATGANEMIPDMGAYMPLTQDLSGNSIADAATPVFDRVDIASVMGGDPFGVYILTMSFTTEDAP